MAGSGIRNMEGVLVENGKFLCMTGNLSNYTGNSILFEMKVNKNKDYPFAATTKIYWTMELQRQNTNGTWSTIGTRTGYINKNSPSNREFVNVRRLGRPLRVKVTINKSGAYTYSGWFTY